MKEILYSEKSKKQLKKIIKSDKNSAIAILNKIENYANEVHDTYDIKFLKGEFGDFKRLRVGNYRVIFDEDMKILSIYEIKHRKEAYK